MSTIIRSRNTKAPCVAKACSPYVCAFVLICGACAQAADKGSELGTYIAGVNGAVAHIMSGNPAAARELLQSLPTEPRNWEWGYLLERCGAPPWKVDLPLQENPRLHPVAEISEKLLTTAKEVAAMRSDSESEDASLVKQVKSPDGEFQALYDPGAGGRPGSYLCLIATPPPPDKDSSSEEIELSAESLATSQNPRVLAALWTGNYGGPIVAARFTPDSSVLIVKAQSDSAFTPSFACDVSNELAVRQPKPGSEDPGEALFFFPVGSRPDSVVPPSSEEGTIPRTPGQFARFRLLPRELQAAVMRIEKYDKDSGKASARLADWYPAGDGSALGLFNCFASESAAEVRELPSGRIVSSLGKNRGFDFGSLPSGMEAIDIGGAFSPDGKMVVVSPVGAKNVSAKKTDEPGDFYGSAAVFRVADGLETVLQAGGSYETARTAFPDFGFSPDSRFVFTSSYDMADCVNRLAVCATESGQPVDGFNPDLRYVAWSPDTSRIYTMEKNSGALTVADSSSLKKCAELPGVTKFSAWPAFQELPVSRTPDGSRFNIGRLVFGEGPDSPMLWLEAAPPESPLTSWLIEALDDRPTASLTVAQAALVYWARRCGDKQNP